MIRSTHLRALTATLFIVGLLAFVFVAMGAHKVTQSHSGHAAVESSEEIDGEELLQIDLVTQSSIEFTVDSQTFLLSSFSLPEPNEVALPAILLRGPPALLL